MLKQYKAEAIQDPQVSYKSTTTEDPADRFASAFGANKENVKKELNQYVAKGMQLIHSDETSDAVISALAKSTNPLQGIADVTKGIMQRVDKAARDAGTEVNDYIKMQASLDLLTQVVEIGEVSGALDKLSSEEVKTAYSLAVQEYMKDEIAAGRVNKEELGKALKVGISRMSPEEQENINQESLKINDVASKYGKVQQTEQKQGGLLNVPSI